MHDLDRTQLEMGEEVFESDEFAGLGEHGFRDLEWSGEMGALSEEEETALATELLTVSSEEELDQFLGKLIRRVGRTVGKIARGPIGGLLKGIAKKALPFVGGALGTMIPVPGVGTAVGTALGTAASKMFEVDLEGLSQEDQEYEVARRFVRLASDAAGAAATAGPAGATAAGARDALLQAAQRHAPGLASMLAGGGAAGRRPRTGQWVRRGRHIILLGA